MRGLVCPLPTQDVAMQQCGCVRTCAGSLITALTAASLVVSDVSRAARDVTDAAHRHCCVGSWLGM
jgi:hypothetical protein